MTITKEKFKKIIMHVPSFTFIIFGFAIGYFGIFMTFLGILGDQEATRLTKPGQGISNVGYTLLVVGVVTGILKLHYLLDGYLSRKK